MNWIDEGPVLFLFEHGEWVSSFLKWHGLLSLSSCSVAVSHDSLVSMTGPERWSSILGWYIGRDVQNTYVLPFSG